MMGIKDEKEAARNGKTWEKESSGGGGGTVYVILPAIATGAVPGELGFKVPITSPPAAVSYPPHQSQKEAHGHEQPTREYYMSPASLVHLGTASGFVGEAGDNPSSAQPISQPPTAVPPASYPAMAVSPITPGGSEGHAQTPASATAPSSLHFQYPPANVSQPLSHHHPMAPTSSLQRSTTINATTMATTTPTHPTSARPESATLPTLIQHNNPDNNTPSPAPSVSTTTTI
jgi:hypothetical protein